MNGDTKLPVYRDVFLLLIGDHNMVDALARGTDQPGQVTLGEANRDQGVACAGGPAILLGHSQKLATYAKLF